jgi:hypothetical protein
MVFEADRPTDFGFGIDQTSVDDDREVVPCAECVARASSSDHGEERPVVSLCEDCLAVLKRRAEPKPPKPYGLFLSNLSYFLTSLL